MLSNLLIIKTSMKVKYLSPVSYLETNDCGSPHKLASSTWVNPIFLRCIFRNERNFFSWGLSLFLIIF